MTLLLGHGRTIFDAPSSSSCFALLMVLTIIVESRWCGKLKKCGMFSRSLLKNTKQWWTNTWWEQVEEMATKQISLTGGSVMTLTLQQSLTSRAAIFICLLCTCGQIIQFCVCWEEGSTAKPYDYWGHLQWRQRWGQGGIWCEQRQQCFKNLQSLEHDKPKTKTVSWILNK